MLATVLTPRSTMNDIKGESALPSVKSNHEGSPVGK